MGRLHQRIRLCGAALAAATLASAQDPVWRIPPLGAVEYRRDGAGQRQRDRAHGRWPRPRRCTERSAGPVPEPPAAGAVGLPRRTAPRPEGTAGPGRATCATCCERSPATSATAVRGRFPRLLPFGDVMVAGSWSPAADGTQTLRATVNGGCRRRASRRGRHRRPAARVLPRRRRRHDRDRSAASTASTASSPSPAASTWSSKRRRRRTAASC
jgi:hypothetical protein